MQGRSRLLIILAFVIVVIGVAAAFLLSQNRPTPPPTQAANTTPGTTSNDATQAPVTGPTATPFPTVLIVVAVQDLKRGMEFTAGAVDVRAWPEPYAPRSAFFATEDGGIPDGIIGNFARTDIQREQPILSTMVVQNLNQLAQVGSDAAAVLPTGTVLVAVPMDRLTSVAYAIQPGDRVDVIVSLLFVDVDLQFQSRQPNKIVLVQQQEDGSFALGLQLDGRFDTIAGFQTIISPSEPQRPRLVTQRTIQDALVVNVGDFPIDGRLFPVVQASPTPAPTATGPASAQQAARGTPLPATTAPPRPDIVALAVSPQDAVTIVWLIEARLPITFALRSVGDSSKVPTDQVTLDYIMQQYRISVPGKTDFSIEPAIRSIRQLIGGNVITLDTVETPTQ
jgi:Flp pilus assembly protein CpaB